MRRATGFLVGFIIAFKMLSAYLIGGKHSALGLLRLDQITKGINYLEFAALLAIIWHLKKYNSVLFCALFCMAVGVTHFYVLLPFNYMAMYNALLACFFSMLLALTGSFFILKLIKDRA